MNDKHTVPLGLRIVEPVTTGNQLKVQVLQGSNADQVLVSFLDGTEVVAEAIAYISEKNGRREIIFEAGPCGPGHGESGEGWIITRPA